MNYPSEGQLELLKSMFKKDENCDSYLQLLTEFGRFVERVILPAETKTDEARAKDFVKEMRNKSTEERTYDNAIVDKIITAAKHDDRDSIQRILNQVSNDTIGEIITELQINHKVPQKTLDQLVETGFRNLSIPEELKGVGLPLPIYIACNETLAKASASLATKYAISNTCAEGLRMDYDVGRLGDYGKDVFHKIIQGKELAAFGLTEANAPGSNILKEMKTKYRLSENEQSVILNGSKMFITNVGEADIYFVFARNKELGVSLFMIDPDTNGFSIGQKMRKVTVQNSTFGEFILEDVDVPINNVVGGIGAGSDYGKRMLNSGRLTVAAVGLGIAERALDEYIIRAEEKSIAGKPLINYDVNKSTKDIIVKRLKRIRNDLYRAALLKNESDANPKDMLTYYKFVLRGTTAKRDATRIAKYAAESLYHISGANAVTVDDYLPQKLVNDARLVEFGEGVEEVLNLTIKNMGTKIYRIRRKLDPRYKYV